MLHVAEFYQHLLVKDVVKAHLIMIQLQESVIIRIIHEARSYVDNSRIYKVSFIGNDGNIIHGNSSENMGITAKTMSSITTNANKKNKCVYDQTIINFRGRRTD